jgi:hypothetical protein
MKMTFRIILLIAVLFSIIGLAKHQLAWAANLSEKSSQATSPGIEKSVWPDKGDYCDQPRNKHKNECKDKRAKDYCKKHRKECASVKPPPQQILIPVTGEYSVGGFCTLSVTLNDLVIKLDAHIKTPLPADLPDKVHKVRQGCLLTYYSSNQRIDELSTNSGSTTICFAATPGKRMTLYFYSVYSSKPGWVLLETTTASGKACAPGNTSGLYVATFQQP